MVGETSHEAGLGVDDGNWRQIEAAVVQLLSVVTHTEKAEPHRSPRSARNF